jgi:cytochrome b561
VPDSARRYGSVSRFFHWGMALCFAVVFAAAIAHYFAKDSAVDALLWQAHKPVGALIFALWILRAVWALLHARQRPPHVLMLAVPAIALLRQYGSGRAFAPFGIPLMQGHDDKISWMTELGSLLHGELGWVLLALVVGHITMALWHRRPGHTNVLPRMIGKP